MSAERARIVAEARRWIGTPYHHMGDVVGAGVDCGMLLVRVFVDAGFVAPFDPRPYPIQWHLHRSDERYLGFVHDRMREVAAPLPGDIVVFLHGRAHSHGGIVTEWPRIIHASAPDKCCLEARVDVSSFARKPRRFFSYFPEGAAP